MVDRSLIPVRLKEVMGKRTAADFIRSIGGGISKQSISSYLSGKRSPKTEFLKAVSDAYGVQIAWLMGFDVPKYVDPNVDTASDEDIVILSRAAKKMSPEDRKKLIELAKVMFDDAFSEP